MGLHFLNTQYTTWVSGKCVIKANDMNPQMSKFATKVGVEALQSAQTEQEAASIIKEQFENLPGGGIWHCLVGRNFGCFVDHQEEHFIYFYVGQIGICIFK